MQEEDNVRDVLKQAFQALNSKDDKGHYFDLHDDALITHGIPGNFTANKEGMKKYYSEVWQAFPKLFLMQFLILIMLLFKELKLRVCSQ